MKQRTCRLARIFLLLSFASLFVCSIAYAEQVESKKFNYKQVMALGKVIELNKKSQKNAADLKVRLFELVSHKLKCFIETHGICQYEYYVAVSTFDEYPETNVFKLKHKGVLIQAVWLKSSKVDNVKLELIMDKYTQAAQKNNKKLINVRSVVLVELSIKSINITIEKN